MATVYYFDRERARYPIRSAYQYLPKRGKILTDKERADRDKSDAKGKIARDKRKKY